MPAHPKRALALVVLATIAILAAALSAVSGRVNSQGLVSHLLTRQPIAGAKVKADCQRSNFFHGSKNLRQAATLSAADGRFAFDPADLDGCSYVLVSTEKAGYRDASLIPNSGIRVAFEVSASIPPSIYMVKESEVAKLQLEGLLLESKATFTTPAVSPEVDYSFVNSRFYESVRVASMPKEIEWVKENYCGRLQVLWTRIPTAEQQRHLEGRFANIVKFPDVLTYCAGKR
jgi:hypothetical protein